MAAHSGSINSVIEIDAYEDASLSYTEVLETLFSSESVQSW